MAKYLYYICACCFLFLFSRCGKGKSESEEIPFNPYVEAFTSGTISRYTPVYLIFNQEIAVDRMEPDQLRDLVKIKPETVGEFAFENNRTIVFKPSKSFERDTRYEVKADLSEWFDTERKDKYFSFRFSTVVKLCTGNDKRSVRTDSRRSLCCCVPTCNPSISTGRMKTATTLSARYLRRTGKFPKL